MQKFFYYKFYITIFLIIFLNFTNIYSSINSKILAKVGNEIITSYELENKIRSILFLSKKEINQENINQVKQKAIKELISKKLKKEEINKYGIVIEDEKVNSYINNVSSKLKINKGELTKIMSQKNINFDLFNEDVRIDLTWQSLIYQLNKKKLAIDESQIVIELNEIIKKNKVIEEYEIAEIVIDGIKDPINQEKINIEVKDYIKKFNFTEAAIKYSTSSSSVEGGKIGWVTANALSDRLQKILSRMKVGEVSNPIDTTNQILIVKILDKRIIKNSSNLDTEQIKQSLINKRQNELLNLYSNNHLSKKRNNTLIKFFNE